MVPASQAYLQSTPATSEPSTITVQSEGVAQQVGTTTIAGLLMTVCFQITDVLFGDVIVCGGQSNMQFTLSDALNATEEIKGALASGLSIQPLTKCCRC